ncbi:MAG: PqqD family protein [Lachnospiraceae bacterium]|jgi:hypothetical protein|nr:PqqD family protein [Lachnospiraceae bacterium]
MIGDEKFQLRHAAGIYWLLDMSQSGKEYQKPITMNESGAFLWKMNQEKRTPEEMVQAICERYHIDEDEALEDVKDFLDKWTIQ